MKILSELIGNYKRIYGIDIFVTQLNAKELRLATLNATPELMSIPIALVTYGMDLRSVLDFCMNTLKPIKEIMSANRFRSDSVKTTSVESAIESAKLDQDTKNSLYTILGLTSELRYLTGLYKINQGAIPNIIEQQRWIANMKRLRKDRETASINIIGYKNQNYNIAKDLVPLCQELRRNLEKLANKDDKLYTVLTRYTLKNVSEITDEDVEDFKNMLIQLFDSDGNSLPINYLEFFREGENLYRDHLIKYFNILAIGHNVLDVVDSSLSFNSLLRALMKLFNCFNLMICTSAISEALINKDLEENANNFKELSSKESDQRVKLLFGHLSVGHFISTLKDFTFVNEDIKHSFKDSVILTGDPESSFDLSSNFGINNFMLIMHDLVIPYLKETYGDSNFFIKSLDDKVNRKTGLIYSTLPFNNYAEEDQQLERSNIDEAKLAFGKIMKYNSGLKNKYGKDLTIGEVFYIYHLIAHAGGMSSMGVCIEQVESYSDLPNQYRDMERLFDEVTEACKGNLVASDSKLINRETIDLLYYISKALDTYDGIAGINEKLTLSLSRLWIYTKAIISNSYKQDNVIDRVKQLVDSSPDFIQNIKYEEDSADASVVKYIVTVNYKVDGLDPVKDTISGYVSRNRVGEIYTVSEQEALKMAYNITSKLKSFEDFIGDSFCCTSVINSENIKEYLLSRRRADSDKTIMENLIAAIPDNTKCKILIGKNTEGTLTVVPRVMTINGEYCLILPNLDLNEKDPNFIDGVLTILTGSHNKTTHIVKLLDLLVDHNVFPKVETFNYKAILRQLTDDKYLDKVKKSESVSEYINWLLNDTINPQFMLLVKFQLNLFEDVFNTSKRDLYYDVVEGEDKTTLNTGDLFNINGIVFMYMGRNDINYYILVPINDPNALPKIESTSPLNRYTKTYSKKRNLDQILGEITVDESLYRPEYDSQLKDFYSLNLGDLIYVSKEDKDYYIVTDIQINKLGELEYILQHNESKEYLLLNEELYKEELQDGATKSIIFNEISKDTELITHEFNLSFTIPTELINLLIKGDIITSNAAEGQFEKLIKYIDLNGVEHTEIIINSNGKQKRLNTEDIIKVKLLPRLGSQLIDKEFNLLTRPVTLYAYDSYKYTQLFKDWFKGYKFLTFDNNPDGLKSIRTGMNKTGLRKYVATDPYNKTILKFRGYLQVSDISTYDILKNDIILYEKDGKTYFMKVLFVDDENCYGIILELDSNILTYGSFLNSTTNSEYSVYTPLRLRGDIIDKTMGVTETIGDYIMGKRILTVLGKRYHLNVALLEVPESPHFAMIENGQIIINLSKFNLYKAEHKLGDEYTINNYIVEKGLHEFTHIIIASLIARDSNVYYELMRGVNTIVQDAGKTDTYKGCWDLKIWDEIMASSNSYPGWNDKLQEYLVRFIEKAYRNNSDTFLNHVSDSALVENIKNIINLEFRKFTNKSGIHKTVAETEIGKLMKQVFLDFQKDVFGYTTTDINMEFIRLNYLNSTYLDDIICF